MIYLIRFINEKENLFSLSPRSYDKSKRCTIKSIWTCYVNLLKKKNTLNFIESSFPTLTILSYLDYHLAQRGHLLHWGMRSDNIQKIFILNVIIFSLKNVAAKI